MYSERVSSRPESVFSTVLLEKLTNPGVIFEAVKQLPIESIYFAVAGIAFNRWVELNSLSESEELIEQFFAEIDKRKQLALRVIDTQRILLQQSAGESTH